MRPRISRAALVRVIRLAAASEDQEICGILRGRGQQIVSLVPAENVAADPRRAFEIEPATLIRCHRLERRGGALAMLGYYHSHPGGDPFPSATDAAQAYPDGRLWLIATGNSARIWRCVTEGRAHGRFDPVAFDMVTGNRIESSLAAIALSGTQASWSVELEYSRD